MNTIQKTYSEDDQHRVEAMPKHNSEDHEQKYQEIRLRPAWRSQIIVISLLCVSVYLFLVLTGYLSQECHNAIYSELMQFDIAFREILQSQPNIYWLVNGYYHYLNFLVPGLILYLLLVLLYRRYSRKYLIGPWGVEVNVGIVRRSTTRLEYRHSRGVNLKQSILERILGFGDIYVSTSGVDTELMILDVRNPKKYSDEIRTRTKELTH